MGVVNVTSVMNDVYFGEVMAEFNGEFKVVLWRSCSMTRIAVIDANGYMTVQGIDLANNGEPCNSPHSPCSHCYLDRTDIKLFLDRDTSELVHQMVEVLETME